MSARSPLAAIQKALYRRLDGDAGLGVPVYDEVPEGAGLPFVKIGEETTENPDNTHDTFGRDCTITLHVWSDRRGFAEASAIADRIAELLDHQPLDLSGGHRAVAVRFVSSQTLRDPTPPYPRHVPMLFRVITAQDA